MNQKVIEYILNAKKKGKTESEIIAALSSIGVKEDETLDALRSIAQKSRDTGIPDKKELVLQMLSSAKKHPGDIFGQNARKNHVVFEPKAGLWSMLSTCIGYTLLNIIIFPLIFLTPITLILSLVYGSLWIKRLRFTLDERSLFVRKGVVLPSYTLLMYENIQDIHVVQGMLEKIFGLWSVHAYTATTGQSAQVIPGLSKENAEKLKDDLFTRIRRSKDVTD